MEDAFCMTICQTSVAPSTMPRIVHIRSSARVPRNTRREPATFVILSRILKDLALRSRLWNFDGGGAICCGSGSLYCGREDEEDADMIGVMSALHGEDSGRSCEGAEISIVECKGGLHLDLFRPRHISPNFPILTPKI
jgi:hypothetical protein